jgi:hypothetical protein
MADGNAARVIEAVDWAMPDDAREALRQAHQMSDANAASRRSDAPWRRALEELTRGFEWSDLGSQRKAAKERAA